MTRDNTARPPDPLSMASQDSARRRLHQPQPQAPWAASDASASSAPTAYPLTQEDLDNYRYAHNRVKTWRQEAFTGRSVGRSVGAGSAVWSSTDSDVSSSAPHPQYRHPLSSHLSSPPPRGAELEAVLATQRRARDASAKIQRGLSKRTPLDPGPSGHRSSAPRPAQLSRSQSSRRPAPVAVLAQAPSSPLPQNVPLPRSDHLPLSSAPTAQWPQREAYLNDALSPPLEFLSDTLPEDPMHATTDRPSGLARVGSFLSRTRSTISRRSSQESLAKAPPPSAFPKAPAVSQPPDVLVMTRSNSVSQARGSSRTAKLARSQSSSAATKNNNSREYAQQLPRPSAAGRGGGNNSVASTVSATAAPVLPELSFDPILPTTTQRAPLSTDAAGARRRSRARTAPAQSSATVSQVSTDTLRDVGARPRAPRTDDTLLLATQHAIPRTVANASSWTSSVTTHPSTRPNSVSAHRVPLPPSTIVSTPHSQTRPADVVPLSPSPASPVIYAQPLPTTQPNSTPSTHPYHRPTALSPLPPSTTESVARQQQVQANLPPLPPSTIASGDRSAHTSSRQFSLRPNSTQAPAPLPASEMADYGAHGNRPALGWLPHSQPQPDLSYSPSEDSDDEMTFPDLSSSSSSQHSPVRTPTRAGRYTPKDRVSTPRRAQPDTRLLASVGDFNDTPAPQRPSLRSSNSDGLALIRAISKLHLSEGVAPRVPTAPELQLSTGRPSAGASGEVSLLVEEIGGGREAEEGNKSLHSNMSVTNLKHTDDHVSFEMPSGNDGRVQVSLSWASNQANGKSKHRLPPADAAGNDLKNLAAESPRPTFRSVRDGLRSPNVSDHHSDRRARVESLTSSLASDLRSALPREPQNWYKDAPPPLPPLAPMPVAAPIFTLPAAVPLHPVVPIIPVHYTHWGFPPTPPMSPFVPVDMSQVYAYAPVPGQQYLVPPMVDGTGLGRRPSSSLSRVNEAERAEYEREKAERRRLRSVRRDERERREGTLSPLRTPEPSTVKAKSAGQTGGKAEGKRGGSGRR